MKFQHEHVNVIDERFKGFIEGWRGKTKLSMITRDDFCQTLNPHSTVRCALESNEEKNSLLLQTVKTFGWIIERVNVWQIVLSVSSLRMHKQDLEQQQKWEKRDKNHT